MISKMAQSCNHVLLRNICSRYALVLVTYNLFASHRVFLVMRNLLKGGGAELSRHFLAGNHIKSRRSTATNIKVFLVALLREAVDLESRSIQLGEGRPSLSE